MTNPYVGGALDLGALKNKPDDDAKTQVSTFFDVTLENLESEVLQRSMQVPVIIMVGTSRSEEVQTMRATLKALATEANRAFLVGYVDADTRGEIAQALGVRGIPTLLALAGGRPIANLEGIHGRDDLSQWINQILQATAGKLQGLEEEGEEESVDPRVLEAEQALAQHDFDKALELYDAMIAEKPADVAQLRQARGTVELLQRRNPEVDALSEAEAAPDDVEKQCAAADAEIIAGAVDDAFDRLLTLMSRCEGEEKQQVKNHLIALFNTFDTGDERVRRARTRLASALY